MNRDRSNDIAVIGVSARFPGAIDMEDWWQALLRGEVFTIRYTREELLAAGVGEVLINDPDYVPVRGHLKNIDRFDNKFFRISNRDSEIMDPQHRLMLEAAWAALEDSGYGNSNDRPVTGVFASGSGSGYMRTILSQGPLYPDVLEQVIHGTEPDFIASLISYKLNLTGPAIAIQTACSSSLVGVHSACQALRNGDCDQALVVAAGIAFPQGGHLYIPGGIHSKSGLCRPFDKEADGVIEGSGVACIVLRRLKDIPNDAPELHGIIIGTAINNDGAAKAGYFAPSITGQIAVIKNAIHAANINANSIGFLETHGTGTHIGDPIEWSSTSEAYKNLGAQPGQIAIGALKANIGHLDAVSGIASLIKAMHVVKEGVIPPVANFNSLNSLMEENNSPLYIANNNNHSWPQQKFRRAAISAFGVGGTNAHIIIEQPPKVEEPQSLKNDKILIIPFSAADQESLNRSTQLLINYLIKNNSKLENVSYTLIKGRTLLSERRVVCGRSNTEVVKKLSNGDGIFHSQPPLNGHRQAIFLFPGQGSQYSGMASPFTTIIPGFLENLNSCLSLFNPELSEILYQALLNSTFPEDKLNQTVIAQPALFALEYAIATSLINLGLKPAAVCGHSLGEITAACLSGILNLEDAVHFVTQRGIGMQSCPKGSMLAVNCDESKLKNLLSQSGIELYITAINTPESCVVAGTPENVNEFRSFIGDDIISRVLKTNRAFHTPLIKPALQVIKPTLEKIEMQFTQIPIALNVTGEMLKKGSKLDMEYFLEQASQTVYFSKALQEINQCFKNATFIEVGPGQILSSMASSVGLNSLSLFAKRSSDPDVEIMNKIGVLWARGFPVDLDKFCVGGKRTHLPTYPFFGPKWMAPEVVAALQIKNRKLVESTQDIVIDQGIQACTHKPLEVLSELSNIWKEVLSYNEVNEKSDFFELGGDSLSITSLIRKVNNTFNINVSPRKMLSARTLSSQAVLIKDTLEIVQKAN